MTLLQVFLLCFGTFNLFWLSLILDFRHLWIMLTRDWNLRTLRLCIEKHVVIVIKWCKNHFVFLSNEFSSMENVSDRHSVLCILQWIGKSNLVHVARFSLSLPSLLRNQNSLCSYLCYEAEYQITAMGNFKKHPVKSLIAPNVFLKLIAKRSESGMLLLNLRKWHKIIFCVEFW